MKPFEPRINAQLLANMTPLELIKYVDRTDPEIEKLCEALGIVFDKIDADALVIDATSEEASNLEDKIDSLESEVEELYLRVE